MDHDDLHDPILLGAPDDLADDPERYELTGLDGAAWAMHTLARSSAVAAGLRRQRDALVAQVDAWYDDRRHAPERAALVAESLLTQFALMARRAGTNTIDTPWGKVATRKRRDALDYDGDAALAEFLGQRVSLMDAGDNYIDLTVGEVVAALRGAGLPLRFKVELDAVEYRKRLTGQGELVVDTTTGEVVGHATFTPGEKLDPTVTITPNDLASLAPALPPVELAERPPPPACSCRLVSPQTHEVPADWEQDPDCPVHPMEPEPAEVEAHDRVAELVSEFINDREGDVSQADIDAFVAELDRGNESHVPRDDAWPDLGRNTIDGGHDGLPD